MGKSEKEEEAKKKKEKYHIFKANHKILYSYSIGYMISFNAFAGYGVCVTGREKRREYVREIIH